MSGTEPDDDPLSLFAAAAERIANVRQRLPVPAGEQSGAYGGDDGGACEEEDGSSVLMQLQEMVAAAAAGDVFLPVDDDDYDEDGGRREGGDDGEDDAEVEAAQAQAQAQGVARGEQVEKVAGEAGAAVAEVGAVGGEANSEKKGEVGGAAAEEQPKGDADVVTKPRKTKSTGDLKVELPPPCPNCRQCMNPALKARHTCSRSTPSRGPPPKLDGVCKQCQNPGLKEKHTCERAKKDEVKKDEVKKDDGTSPTETVSATGTAAAQHFAPVASPRGGLSGGSQQQPDEAGEEGKTKTKKKREGSAVKTVVARQKIVGMEERAAPGGDAADGSGNCLSDAALGSLDYGRWTGLPGPPKPLQALGPDKRREIRRRSEAAMGHAAPGGATGALTVKKPLGASGLGAGGLGPEANDPAATPASAAAAAVRSSSLEVPATGQAGASRPAAEASGGKRRRRKKEGGPRRTTSYEAWLESFSKVSTLAKANHQPQHQFAHPRPSAPRTRAAAAALGGSGSGLLWQEGSTL